MRRLTLLLAVGICSLVAVAVGSAAILPPSDRGHDDLGKWAKKFFQYDAELPVVGGSHPGLDLGDVDCSVGQHGKVWFLETAPAFDGDMVRNCSVPAKTTLYVPVFQAVCSHELDGDSIDHCLSTADEVLGAVDNSLTVDSQVLDDAALEEYRAGTGTFRLGLAEHTIWEDLFGIELGKSMDFGADAIGVLVDGLSVGRHTIVVEFASTELGFDGSLTYHLTVTEKGK